MMSVATMEPTRDSPVLSGVEHKVWPKRQSWRCKNCSERAVTQLGRFRIRRVTGGLRFFEARIGIIHFLPLPTALEVTIFRLLRA